MIVVTGHQPAYIPWLGLFHKIAVSDIYVYLDSVQYEKKSFINRNKIKIPQGNKFKWLSIPVHTNGYKEKTINDMEIDNTSKWQSSHHKTISAVYKKAPYYESYSDFINKIYKKEWKFLTDLNEYSMKFFLKELDINIEFIKLSDLKIKNKKSDMVLELCEKLNADIIVFGALGKNYVNINDFEAKGIKTYFQDYNHPIYPQLWGDFISHLSIIDLLLNVGPEDAKKIIMQDNIKKEDLFKLTV